MRSERNGAPQPSAEEVIGYFDDLSNWGRWGVDDRLGTLNLITPHIRQSAAGLVEAGAVVPLSYDIDPENPDPLHSGIGVIQRFMGIGEFEHHAGRGVCRVDAVTEYVGLSAHGGNTHVDGLGHYSWDGKNYNGFDVAENTTSIGGSKKLSVHQACEGIVGRGVLLDMCALHGVEWLEPGHAISPDELRAAEDLQGVTVTTGDILLIHTGDAARTIALGPAGERPPHARAGLGAGCLPLLRERDIAALGSDAIQDVQPSGYDSLDLFRPVHTVSLVALGLWLIDNMALTELARTCAELRRWSFFFAMLPWRMVGVTSCATNPIAMF
jgi:kynurenine formamidase